MRKLAVITGGTKGIGRAVTERFAAEGFDVAVSARTESDLSRLKEQLEKQHKVSLFTTRCDMSEREDVRNFTNGILKLNRPIDVLVNNAGYFVPGQVTDEPDGTLESMISANLYSAYYTTRGLVEAFRKQRYGHIFNLCSIASLVAYKDGGAYTVSKFALLGFSKVLRQELMEFGVKVTAVLPGATLTPSWEGTTLPSERFMKPEDVADSVFAAYSLSPRSVVEEILIRPMQGDI